MSATVKSTGQAVLGGKSRTRPNLVKQVSSELRKMILSGDLLVGDKLPSEAALTRKHAVSRTVIREALAALRADGLVEARQGSGVFVIEQSINTAQGFSVISPEKISSVIEVLELRSPVEQEAAGLAAIRRSPSHEEKIFECHRRFEACIKHGESTTVADFELHLAIADASNNPRFREFMELIGRNAIPRLFLQEDNPDKQTPFEYLSKIHQEHEMIINAISQRDENAAREAMRNHLKGSEQRYRALLRSDPNQLV